VFSQFNSETLTAGYVGYKSINPLTDYDMNDGSGTRILNPTTGEIVTSNGSPVYRSTTVVAENSGEQDFKLASDKVGAQTATKATTSFAEANK
jgi:hypothetical protein